KITPEIEQRLNYELEVIHNMGFDNYFLIVWDIVRFAKSRGILVGPGRGSAAASMVSYCLGITELDPLKHGLIFERFLNPGRVTMPDIDMDFPDDRRDEVIQYVVEKYGSDRVAQIITFGTMGAKAAIRDVGKAMDLPPGEVDRLAKMIPPGPKVTIDYALSHSPRLRELYEESDYIQKLIETAKRLEGVARHASTHAAGIVVADAPLVNYTPLHRPTRGEAGGSIVTQYPMEILEELGLLKIDLLGLSTLTIIQKTLDLIKERHGIELRPQDIPLDDPAIYELLSSGEVTGIFQVESAGMRRVLTRLKPSVFDDVVAVLALYRPGPMQYIDLYIDRKHGRKPVEYRHPALEPILKETYGIIIYQEQIIRIATDLAGYTASEADLMRRAVGKKKEKELLAHRKKFVEGAVARGIPRNVAEQIFKDIEYFANYGFNKCLPGDVEVVDADTGRLVKIAELYNGTRQIASTLTCDINGLKLHKHPIAGVHYNGVKPVYRLRTHLGREIEATANHPFYTFNGWKRLDELKPGDLIAVPRCLPVEGKAQWPDHEVIVLGYLLAEGNLCHPGSVYFYTKSKELLEDYVRAAEQFENVKCTISLHKGTYSVYAKRIKRDEEAGIVRWAKKLGIWGKRASEKEIPPEAFELNNRQIALLLSRLWSGDGYVNKCDGYFCAYYATASERLARQVQHLLLRLGVVSKLRTVEFPYRGGRTGYQVYVMGGEHLKNFAATIGVHFIEPHLREICEEILQGEYGTARGTRDVIPVPVKEIVRAEKAAAGITWRQMRTEAGVAQREFQPTGSPSKRGFRRETIARLADYFDSSELRRYSDSDIYWDEIESIEYVGDKPTYDLTVPDLHNFIANDILVHNSHASAYAVLTCQTAYLKAHYPAEYMTAMLTVERHNTDKLAVLITECRRMGIEVLPPDVNKSGRGFTIEEWEEDGKKREAIRFGLEGVKNVGSGSVEAILRAREKGGPFKDLEDFCLRVDLKEVGRKALECLIKVGALDAFGGRAQLLQFMDQMIAVSAEAHRAAGVGQLTFFYAIPTLPPLPKARKVSRREMLDWERELVGVYVSEHPLQQVMPALSEAITHFCGQINEELDGQKVTIAGMVTNVREITTKRGEPMAFAQVEDIQGSIEVVIFPRVYRKTAELWDEERILIIKGRVDMRNGRPAIICDSVQDHVTLIRPKAQEPSPEGTPSEPDASPETSPALTETSSSGKHIHITLRRTGDEEADVRRLGEIYHLLTSYKGNDRFTFYVTVGEERFALEFPNVRTKYCEELEQKLINLLGEGAIKVN
ncbi:MAG: DNA polymerase III subunit alpha, partial [Chloroflexi bacterium]